MFDGKFTISICQARLCAGQTQTGGQQGDFGLVRAYERAVN